jgi:hypothetical protein
MSRRAQIGANLVLYAGLLWLLYDATLGPWRRGGAIDWWFAFVIAFVIVMALALTFIPGLRAERPACAKGRGTSGC